MNNQESNSGNAFVSIIKFLPLLLFIVLVIVLKQDLLLAAPIATTAAVLIAMFTTKQKFSAIYDIGVENASKLTLVFFILMFAFGVAECFMASGVGAAIIRIALSFGVSGKTVALVGFLVTCVLSIATGTSWGTFAACAPMFLWLNYIVGGDIILTVCSVAGGTCFGDCIGFISDTTVLSSGMQEVNLLDRFKHQGIWSLSCMILTAIIILLLSMGLSGELGDATNAVDAIPAEAITALETERPSALILLQQVKAGVPMYMVLPLIIVIGLAVTGVQTMLCLGAGMLSALLLGMLAGTMDLTQWLDILLAGFGDAGSWTIVMMLWVAAFGGVMSSMKAFDPVAKLVVKLSKKVRHLMGWCAVICLAGDAALADETAEIATMSPIIRSIVEDNVDGSPEAMYTLRLRLATFADALGVYGSQLIPWHCYVVFYASIANAVYPLYTFTPMDIVSKNVMGLVAVSSMLILTFTGLDKYVPMFKIPEEPVVKLKKYNTAKLVEVTK